MTTQIQFQSFNFQSSAVRVITDPTGEFWFCANDVCAILDYANPRQAVQKNCKSKGVSIRDTLTNGGNQEMIYINEPNLYRLIIKSRKPEAEPFEAWVFEEVLPQIRKTGKYSVQQQLALPEPEPKYPFELTEYELEQLAWLCFSHRQMNDLLGLLIEPLDAIGSRYSASVYSHHHEYKRHYQTSIATIQRLAENTGNDGYYGAGHYFTPDLHRAKAYGENAIGAFLNIKNPVENNGDVLKSIARQMKVKFRGYELADTKEPLLIKYLTKYGEKGVDFSSSASKLGYDGSLSAMSSNDLRRDSTYEIVAFDPNQIKSATDKTKPSLTIINGYKFAPLNLRLGLVIGNRIVNLLR